MSKGQGKKVNRKQLADIFGISLPTVDAWVRSGAPYDQKGDRGKEWMFDTADVMRWRERRAVDEVGGADTQDEAALDRRKKLAAARLSELELAQKMGELAPVDHMERIWSRIVAETQSNFRGAFIRRCAQQLVGETDKREFQRVLLAEVDSTLESLAKMDLSEADESEAADED